MIDVSLGIRRGDQRKLSPDERRAIGAPSSTWLTRDGFGNFGIRSGARGAFVGVLTRDQLRAILALHGR